MPDKPNILVIWGDDIGITNLSCYSDGLMGYRTKNIDRIADEGMRFTDAYGEQSCTAGRSSFITGQSVFRTGLSKVGLPGSPAPTAGLLQRCAHECRTDALALARRQHPDRTERHHAHLAHPSPAALHVANHGSVAIGHKRERALPISNRFHDRRFRLGGQSPHRIPAAGDQPRLWCARQRDQLP